MDTQNKPVDDISTTPIVEPTVTVEEEVAEVEIETPAEPAAPEAL